MPSYANAEEPYVVGDDSSTGSGGEDTDGADDDDTPSFFSTGGLGEYDVLTYRPLKGGGVVQTVGRSTRETLGGGLYGRTPSFLFVQVMTFVAVYVSYFFYLINRKSFSYAQLPFYEAEYVSPFEIDVILSSLSVAYAVSRCCGGILSDRISPTTLLTVGLFTSSLLMIAFADSDNILNYVTLAFLNGSVQGFGWAAAAKLIKIWFDPTHLGTWWAVFSTSTNVAGTAGPHIVNFLSSVHTWRIAVQLPAIIGLILSLVFFFTMRDRPSDVGYKRRDPNAVDRLVDGGRGSAQGWGHVMSSPVVWVLTGGSAVVYAVRASTHYWGQHLLGEERGLSEVTVAAYLHSLQLGGFVGTIIAGVLSDFMVKSKSRFRVGNPRMLLTQIYVAGIAICLNLMVFTVEHYTSTLWVTVLGSMMGFSLYGSICLFGTMAMDCAPPHLVGFMHTLLAMSANVGGMLAGEGVFSGMPVAFISQYVTWVWAFVGLEVLCAMAFFMLVLTKDVPHVIERPTTASKKRS